MEEEKQGVEQTPPSALADAIASSPEALEEQPTQETETPTPQEGITQEQEEQQTEEEQRVPYSRVKEVVDEKNWYKQQMESILQRQQPQQPSQPTTDPYSGMTAEEEKFWRAVDARAEKIAEQKVKQISPIIDAGRMELAAMKVQQFRASHPDVRPD